jgi:hypothetical protein
MVALWLLALLLCAGVKFFTALGEAKEKVEWTILGAIVIVGSS